MPGWKKYFISELLVHHLRSLVSGQHGLHTRDAEVHGAGRAGQPPAVPGVCPLCSAYLVQVHGSGGSQEMDFQQSQTLCLSWFVRLYTRVIF